MTALRRTRWAISFADLALLLLGFFVLLHASDRGRKAVVSGVGSYFGAHPAVQSTNIPAATLFASGEAMLTPAGTARLANIARAARRNGHRLEIISLGQDMAARRFDAWDLAAARTGAVARALRAQGMADTDLIIAGLEENRSGTAQNRTGQVIRITPLPAQNRSLSGYGT